MSCPGKAQTTPAHENGISQEEHNNFSPLLVPVNLEKTFSNMQESLYQIKALTELHGNLEKKNKVVSHTQEIY